MLHVGNILGLENVGECSSCTSCPDCSFSGFEGYALASQCKDSQTYTIVRGVAKACSKEWYGIFQGLQRALNNFGNKQGLVQRTALKLTVDGEIGPTTMLVAKTLFAKTIASAISPAGTLTNPTSVEKLAKYAKEYAVYFSIHAEVPADFTPKGGSPPSFVSSSDSSEPSTEPETAGGNRNLFLIAGAAAAGLATFWFLGKGKKRKNSRKSRNRRRR